VNEVTTNSGALIRSLPISRLTGGCSHSLRQWCAQP
jgi:hypothetical protein